MAHTPVVAGALATADADVHGATTTMTLITTTITGMITGQVGVDGAGPRAHDHDNRPERRVSFFFSRARL